MVSGVQSESINLGPFERRSLVISISRDLDQVVSLACSRAEEALTLGSIARGRDETV